MTMDNDPPPPSARPHRSAAEVRREREADALRANLRKRKEQQRARQAPSVPDADTSREDPSNQHR